MKTVKFYVTKSVTATITVLLLLIASSLSAKIYYISPAGNDATGNGSKINPWKSLYKATASVITAGDTIYVNAGTYTETAQCMLKPGVNIQGDIVGTAIIKSTLSAQLVEIINLRSNTEGVNGNQFIANLTFNGQNRTTNCAIAVYARSNVSIHHCTFTDFDETAVFFIGRTDFNLDIPPAAYASGNSFYNNTVTNCSKADNLYARGALWCAGQQDILIYNNTLTQNTRGAGLDGYLIKMQAFIKGVKIYNNIITKSPYPYAVPGTNNFWDFAIEIFDVCGCEIYNNTIQGTIDANRLTKGTYAYSMYVHNNTIGFNSFPANPEHGIILEYGVETAIIDSNIFKNVATVVEFSTRNQSAINDVRISRNLMHNLGHAGSTGMAVIYFITDGSDNYTIHNFYFWNNTVLSNPAGANYYGLTFSNAASIKNLRIENNIGENVSAIIASNKAQVIDSFYNRNNNWYNNSYGNGPWWMSGTPTHAFTSGNTNLNSNLDANFKPLAGSPLIDAGLLNGLTYTGIAPDKGFAEYQSALPVKLTELTVAPDNGSNVLQWKTASELNSSHFIVQRSSNGRDFENIGTVQAAGFSNSIRQYTFTDFAPYSYINYYRIIITDKDNTKEYSYIVLVKADGTALDIIGAHLYASANSLNVIIAAKKEQNVLLSLFDNEGKAVFNERVKLREGTNYFNKTIQQTARGIYHVRLQTGKESIARSILSSN